MSKLTVKQFKQKGVTWLQKNNWKVSQEKLQDLLEKRKLEVFPYIPHFLMEKDGFKFVVTLFNKEDYFYSKSVECYVTGFDYWKYKMLKEFQHLIGVPAGVVFYSEETREFIFRQLDELPNPIIWQRSQCLEHDYMRHSLILNCVECRQQQRYTFRKCTHRKNKLRPMAVWPIKHFADNTAFQTRIFEISK